jgi:DNA polymerase IV
MRHVIAHLDLDAFYASVELLRRPGLRGRPVIVSGNGPRAVVTTATYEARKFGVGSAMPTSRALRLCPQAVLIPPDFAAYKDASTRVWDIVRRHVEVVEQAGMDEGYLDLTEHIAPKAAMRRLVSEIRAATGLNASVGIGPNKLVAKVASDADKPDGFCVLSREMACERFANASPGLIPGIGPKTVARLEQLGIATLGRLGATPDEQLSQWFGPRLGPHLAGLARFEDARAIETVRVAKSESRETTFDRDLHGLPQLEPVLERLTGELCETLAREERRGRTIGIKVRFADFSTVTRARSLEIPVNDTRTVGTVALELLRRLDPRRPVRLLGVRVAGLDEDAGLGISDDQLSLSL